MNHIETATVNQPKIRPSSEMVIRDLRQAVKVINADYQQLDLEDTLFLNSVLTDALDIIESKEGLYAHS